MRMPQTLAQAQAHRTASRIPGGAGAYALEAEVLAEKAAVLGALGRRVEEALARLAAFESNAALRPADRLHLVAGAADAVWDLLVHQEACGVVDEARLLRDFAVPDEVQRRIGVRRFA